MNKPLLSIIIIFYFVGVPHCIIQLGAIITESDEVKSFYPIIALGWIAGHIAVLMILLIIDFLTREVIKKRD